MGVDLFSASDVFISDPHMDHIGGHPVPKKVCCALLDKPVKNLYFFHHGRLLLNDHDGVLAGCRKILPAVVLCNDGDVSEIS
ncbi:MAG: hypothetical protein IJ325_12170 [Clostridia bacterium]|nr:hypothetical protein [Clostridia bacterium]